MRTIEISTETFPFERQFTISRGSKTEAVVVVCRITEDGYMGWGECVPYARYGETIASVIRQLEDASEIVAQGADRLALLESMPAGAARNAFDCAIWDLESKKYGRRVHMDTCRLPVRPVPTATTISLGSAEEMANQARAHAEQGLLKVKVGTEDDTARIHAVASSAPSTRIILDANEGWREENIRRHLLAAAEMHISLIEQPLPVGEDQILAKIPHPVPICADESAHVTEDLAGLCDRYDAVNIKLDKTGGLTEALRMRDEARKLGFGVMVGCMAATSLSMAPAVLLAQDADYVDLDGPLFLSRDRSPGLSYTGTLISPPAHSFWG